VNRERKVGPLLTTFEAAAFLRISRMTLKDWRSDRRGPAYVRFGRWPKGHVRYRLRDLEAFLDRRTVRTSGK